MPTKVSYSPADLSRAFDLANRVAPTSKGGAWDKAAGMLMEVDPDGTTVVRATDLDRSVYVVFDASEMKDPPEEAFEWRVSSLFLAPFVRTLDKTVTVTPDSKNNAIVFRSGQSRLSVPLMDSSQYPDFEMPPTMVPTDGTNLAALADRVIWACDANSKTTPLAGLHADGDNVVGASHEKMSLLEVPLEIPKPITFPARELISLAKGFSDVRISADDSRVFLWLSDTDWISSNLIIAPYPKYENLRFDFWTDAIVLSKVSIQTSLERLSIIAAMDRGGMTGLTLAISENRLNMKVFVKEVGDVEEALTITGGPDEGVGIKLSLSNFAEAVRNVDGTHFTLQFGNKNKPGQAHLHPVKITDETGWEATLMPRRT
jgi:DNA polymerase III sliding clamp (beta) subunit (PCNA family)